MRLNFSGVDEGQIREGIRRLGEVVREQVALYGTLTGARPEPRRGRASATVADPTPRVPEEQLADVLRLPRKRA
jgi:2-aminoadipate transaminase